MMILHLIVLLLLWSFGVQEIANCPTPDSLSAPSFSYQYEAGEDLAEKWNQQVLDFLNTTGSTAGLIEAIQATQPLADQQPTITAEIFEADMNGDGSPDQLVNINLAWGAGYNRVLSVYGCSSSHYALLSTLTGGDFFDRRAERPPTQIASVVDMNTDGSAEIISREITVTQKFHEAARIYSMVDGRLIQVFDSGYSLGFLGNIEIRNADNNLQTLGLLLNDSYAYGQGVALGVIELIRWRPIQTVYAWDGQTFTANCRYFTDNPTTLFETLHSAEAYRACGNFNAALAAYQRLIHDSTLLTWAQDPEFTFASDEPNRYAIQAERAYLTAFAYYRSAQIELASGNVQAARDIADNMLTAFPPGQQGHQYAAMTSAMATAYEQSEQLDMACNAAESALEEVHQSGTDPGIDPDLVYYDHSLGWGFYYYSGFNYASDPHDIFTVPEAIDDMVKTPVCLS
jgi:hypothetical protein